MRPLTILNISQNYHIRGGSDKIFFALGELLSRKGHRVIPFAGQSPDNEASEWSRYFPPAADFERPGPLDIMRFIYSLPARRAIENVIEKYRPDLAHLHIYYGKITGSILPVLKAAGIPIVQTLHEYKLICPVYTLVSNGRICEACEGKHFWRAFPRRCNRGSLSRTALSVVESYFSHWNGSVRLVDKFIAVSDALRQKMIQYRIPSTKIVTLHNWIDAANVPVADKPGQYFLYFGRLEHIKGIYTLLKASSQVSDIPLLLVGEGNACADILKFIEEKGWFHIKWLGFKREMALQDLIHNSICTIMPSEWYEPFGMTVLETYAHGRPAIGADIGGIPEIIAHGETGFLFSPGNDCMLADHLRWMAENPDDALKMGQAGRRKIEAHFSPDLYYERLMRIYDSVLSPRKASETTY